MKLLRKTQVFANKWLQVYAKTYLKDDGKEADFFVIGQNKRIASIFAVDDQDRILLVKQYRWAVEAETVDIPGGNVEEGEEPLEAAQRELVEETGLTAQNWELLSRRYIDSGQKDAIQYIFLATNLVPATQQRPLDEDEEITAHSRTKISSLEAQLFEKGSTIESSVAIGLAAYRYRVLNS